MHHGSWPPCTGTKESELALLSLALSETKGDSRWVQVATITCSIIIMKNHHHSNKIALNPDWVWFGAVHCLNCTQLIFQGWTNVKIRKYFASLNQEEKNSKFICISNSLIPPSSQTHIEVYTPKIQGRPAKPTGSNDLKLEILFKLCYPNHFSTLYDHSISLTV